MASAESIGHLQSRLVRLLEQVTNNRFEHPALRAEVLLTMNQLCSAELMLSVWEMLSEVGAREEMTLVRLLQDMESGHLEQSAKALLGARDPEVRSVGYAVIALRGRPAGADLLVRGLEADREALFSALDLELAPHSPLSCLIGGFAELKEPRFDGILAGTLRSFVQEGSEVALFRTLMRHPQPSLARIGFVGMASRFMAMVHRFAYDEVICRGGALSNATRGALQEMLRRAPEVVEAIASAGPQGLDGVEFVHARVRLLRRLGPDLINDLVCGLIRGRVELPSHEIERRMARLALQDHPETNRRQTNILGFLLALLTGHRAGVARLIAGLGNQGELEILALTRLLELGDPRSALNLSMSLVGHWHQLRSEDRDEGPFRRWIDGLWQDDRHARFDAAIDAALACPDETAIYASKVVMSVGDGLGKLTSRLHGGRPMDLSELSNCLEDARLIPALRGCLRSPDAKLHVSSFLTLARAGLIEVGPSLRAIERNAGESEEVLGRALLLLRCQEIVDRHPLYRQLLGLGLRALDRDIEPREAALERLEGDAQRALASPLGGRHLFCIYFWLPDTRLPERVGARPSSGFATRAEFVIDLKVGRVQHAAWYDREGNSREVTSLPKAPEGREGFQGIPWDTPLEHLPEEILSRGGEVESVVRLGSARAATRLRVRLGEQLYRFETDELGRFSRVLRPTGSTRLDAAIQRFLGRFGAPHFRTDSVAVWRFQRVDFALRPDPAFDSLAEVVQRRRD